MDLTGVGEHNLNFGSGYVKVVKIGTLKRVYRSTFVEIIKKRGFSLIIPG